MSVRSKVGARSGSPPVGGGNRIVSWLDRLPGESAGGRDRLLWGLGLLGLIGGLVCWLFGWGFVALWLFVVASVAIALVLPLSHAFVLPLYMGLIGWLVDMLPFLILSGWATVVARWVWGLVRERRLPRGNRMTYLPIFLVGWTALGVLVISGLDFKRFVLLLGIQVLSSGTVLALIDSPATIERREIIAMGLVWFVIIMSVGALAEWVGVPIQELQDNTVARRAEAAYGLDAFPNNIGMIKYARSVEAGSLELQNEIRTIGRGQAGFPPVSVFLPKFEAFENHLVVRFDGSARPFESELRGLSVDLIYDNIGVAPANTVPRLRSFPRNALTYAGTSAAVLPFAFFLAWSPQRRKRLLGQAGVAACLFGAGFSLARGAWLAILIGVVYLAVDGVVNRRHKLQVVAACVAGAVVLTAVFLVKYQVDPLTGRAGGGASVTTRGSLYEDTLGAIGGIHFLIGYGTEQPRTESGTTKVGGKYVPLAGTHSTYLNYLFRAGVPAALGLIALYVMAGLHARAAAREKEGRDGLFYTLATTAVVIVTAHAVILSLYVEPVYTLAVSLVVGLALAGTTNLRGTVIPWRAEKP